MAGRPIPDQSRRATPTRLEMFGRSQGTGRNAGAGYGGPINSVDNVYLDSNGTVITRDLYTKWVYASKPPEPYTPPHDHPHLPTDDANLAGSIATILDNVGVKPRDKIDTRMIESFKSGKKVLAPIPEHADSTIKEYYADQLLWHRQPFGNRPSETSHVTPGKRRNRIPMIA